MIPDAAAGLRASATKSRAFTASTSPRTTRAKRTQMRTVIAMAIVRRPGPRLTASSSAIRMVGNVKVASTARMRKLSVRPPR
jgi:hypothetical protein